MTQFLLLVVHGDTGLQKLSLPVVLAMSTSVSAALVRTAVTAALVTESVQCAADISPFNSLKAKYSLYDYKFGYKGSSIRAFLI